MQKTLHHADGSTRQVHLGGWKKQHTDVRDEAYRLKLHGALLAIPASYDNRPVCSPVVDQGELGSCTANMFAGLVESNEVKRLAGLKPGLGAVVSPTGTLPTVATSGITVSASGVVSFNTTVTPGATPAPTPTPTPTPTPSPTPATLEHASRLFEYYGTRKIEGTVSEDSGASIRDAIKCGVTYGVADEKVWPYDITKFTANPPAAVWSAAATHKVTSYHSITDGDTETMKSTLASGFLIGFGFQVYDFMMGAAMAKNACLSVPQKSEALQGGHAVCLVGYDDNKTFTADGTTSKGAFLVRNSWGTGWGLAGYFWMSYDYVASTSLCSDFWVVVSAPI